MSFANEAVQSLGSAIRILRHEPDAFDGFNLTIEGFWRSFLVIAVLMPACWIMIISAEQLALESADTAAQLTPAQGSVFIIAFLIAWPLAAAGLARGFGLGANYLRYMIAYNWLSVPLSVLLLVPNLAYLAGLIGAGLCSALSLVTYAITLFYCWYLARTAFQTTTGTAFVFLLSDFALSLALSYLVAL